MPQVEAIGQKMLQPDLSICLINYSWYDNFRTVTLLDIKFGTNTNYGMDNPNMIITFPYFIIFMNNYRDVSICSIKY